MAGATTSDRVPAEVPLILEGERVSLRPLRRADAPAVERWLHDPETSRWMVLARTAPSAEKWIAEQADGWPRHVVRAIHRLPGAPGLLIVDEGPCGVVGLYDIDWLQRRAELRIVIGGEGYRRLGLGTEAVRLMVDYGFRALDLYRIWLGTAEDNFAARGCFEKAGFVREGTLIDDFLGPDGQRSNNLRYGMIRDAKA